MRTWQSPTRVRVMSDRLNADLAILSAGFFIELLYLKNDFRVKIDRPNPDLASLQSDLGKPPFHRTEQHPLGPPTPPLLLGLQGSTIPPSPPIAFDDTHYLSGRASSS